MKKVYSVFYISLVVLSLAITTMYLLFLMDQKAVSVKENRNLALSADIAETTFMDQSFQSKLELVISDQFFYRDGIVTIKNKVDRKIKEAIIGKQKESYKLTPASEDSNRYQIGSSNYLMYYPMHYEKEIEDTIVDRVYNIDRLNDDYPDIDVFIYQPIQAQQLSIFDEANDIESTGQFYIDLINNSARVPSNHLKVNNLEEYQERFFASDHHWNYYGSYLGYQDIINLIAPEDDLIEPTTLYCDEEVVFYGTHASATGGVYGGDVMCAYGYDYVPYTITFNGEEIEDTQNVNLFVNGKANLDNSYYYDLLGSYYSGAIFDTNRDDKENLLVIGDSYMSAVSGLLTSHFNETHFISPMDYYVQTGFKTFFNIDDYLAEHDIDKILFMYTIENYFLNDSKEIYELARNEVE